MIIVNRLVLQRLWALCEQEFCLLFLFYNSKVWTASGTQQILAAWWIMGNKWDDHPKAARREKTLGGKKEWLLCPDFWVQALLPHFWSNSPSWPPRSELWIHWVALPQATTLHHHLPQLWVARTRQTAPTSQQCGVVGVHVQLMASCPLGECCLSEY